MLYWCEGDLFDGVLLLLSLVLLLGYCWLVYWFEEDVVFVEVFVELILLLMYCDFLYCVYIVCLILLVYCLLELLVRWCLSGCEYLVVLVFEVWSVFGVFDVVGLELLVVLWI